MSWTNRASLGDASEMTNEMTKKKSTRITVETERLYSISRPQCLFALCEACGDEVRLVTVNQAAAMAGFNSLAVYRLVEAGALHYEETFAGELLVCTVSLGEVIHTRREKRYDNSKGNF